MKFLLECFIFLGQIGTFGPQLCIHHIKLFLFFLFFRAETFKDGVFLFLLFEDVLVGDEDFVLFVLEVVVLAS